MYTFYPYECKEVELAQNWKNHILKILQRRQIKGCAEIPWAWWTGNEPKRRFFLFFFLFGKALGPRTHTPGVPAVSSYNLFFLTPADTFKLGLVRECKVQKTRVSKKNYEKTNKDGWCFLMNCKVFTSIKCVRKKQKIKRWQNLSRNFSNRKHFTARKT